MAFTATKFPRGIRKGAHILCTHFIVLIRMVNTCKTHKCEADIIKAIEKSYKLKDLGGERPKVPEQEEVTEEDILWEEGKSTSRRNRLINQLALVYKLREMGYTNNVLVSIFW